MYVLTYEDDNSDQENFLVRPCQHCTNAPCEKVCPVRARHTRDKDGIVLTNYEVCIGCRYCQVACPYGVNYFQWGEPDVPYEDLPGSENDYEELKQMPDDERNELLTETNDHIHDGRGQWADMRPPQGVMGKCTYCPSRQDGHQGEEKVGTVACMEACDAAGMSAIHFGDMNDPESRPQQYLRQRAEQEFERDTELDNGEEWGDTVTPWGKLSAFQLLEDLGTQPNVVYLGNEPGPDAEQVEGPVTYEQIGADDNRKEHLNQFTFGTGDD
jgi:molybdopterin-containing oxidoreductase family iron-sulfur binding subunit